MQNFPKADKKPGISDLNVVEACSMETYSDIWIIDLRVTNYICYFLQRFKHTILLKKRTKKLT